MRAILCPSFVLTLVSLLAGQTMPAAKGPPYKAPAGDLKQEVLWGSQCEEPEGQGLAFSGQSQIADDGQPHTRIKDGDAWRPIVNELRKANPLQKCHDEAWAVRTAMKNILTRERSRFFEGRLDQPSDYLARLKDMTTLVDSLRTLGMHLQAQAPPGLDLYPLRVPRGDHELQALTDPGYYRAGQVAFAEQHLAFVLRILRPLWPEGHLTPDYLAALRQMQQHLEIAAEALDAEPPPRACSPIVYDPASKLYVLFGGDHFDYLTNDTWVFDPARRRWFQRHPEAAPAPRADHALKAAGDGKVTMSGGYTYTSSTGYGSNQYCHVGDGEWTYDIAANRWAGPEGAVMQPADSRTYRTGPYLPEHFMEGLRPDAAANADRLKNLPVNVWTKMGVPQFLFLNRDWGTVALDADRDMLIYWSGGHCVHSGSDVPHYHLSTNRWELHFPIEMPLGFIGASGVGVAGRNFNGRPWMSNHTWKAYVYDSDLKKLVVVGRNNQKFDRYTYLYDPGLGDWTERFRVPDGMDISPLDVNVCVTPKGVLAWTRDRAILYMLDRSALKWDRLKFEGKLPQPTVDNASMVYDPKRDQVLFVQKLYGEAYPFDGQIHALDMKTLKVTPLSPAGMDRMARAFAKGIMREVAYEPQADLFLWASWLPGNRMLAYDLGGNRWVGLKLGGSAPFDVSAGMVYDPKRGLVWLVEGARTAGEVFVLRLDAAKADVQAVADLPMAAPLTRPAK